MTTAPGIRGPFVLLKESKAPPCRQMSWKGAISIMLDPASIAAFRR